MRVMRWAGRTRRRRGGEGSGEDVGLEDSIWMARMVCGRNWVVV